jgi:coiled-coil domain-containing protein 115
MAESRIPTPPQIPPSAPEPSAPEPVPEVSLERLDSLLETYLELLDEYTRHRTQLSKQFSDGFFSLARANHTPTSLGSGRRYGEEGYDERMKAQRRLVYPGEGSRNGRNGNSTEAEETDVCRERKEKDMAAAQQDYRISIQKTKDVAKAEQTSRRDSEQSESAEERKRPPTGESTAAPTSSPSTTMPKYSPESKAKAKAPPSKRDPLNWYGILVPPPLRQAQATFISAVENSIPQLLNTSTSMRDLETQITNLRTELGLRPGNVADHGSDEMMGAHEQNISVSGSSSTSRRRRLVQRPPEPRSRIIKLDG